MGINVGQSTYRFRGAERGTIIQKEFGGVRSQGQEYVRTFRGKGFRKEMDKGFKEEKRETKGIISLVQSLSRV